MLNSICPIPYFVNITDEFANMFLSLLLKIKSPSYLLPNQVSLAKVQLFAEELSNGLLIFKLFESANLVEVNSKFAANMEV